MHVIFKVVRAYLDLRRLSCLVFTSNLMRQALFDCLIENGSSEYRKWHFSNSCRTWKDRIRSVSKPELVPLQQSDCFGACAGNRS